MGVHFFMKNQHKFSRCFVGIHEETFKVFDNDLFSHVFQIDNFIRFYLTAVKIKLILVNSIPG